MLNIIWPVFIIISIIYGILTGRMEELNNSIFESSSEAVKLTITFFGTLCLWNGVIQIAAKTSLISNLTKLLSPFLHFLFPEIKKDEKVYKEIAMNIVANLLGLGNAATPLGLKAMQSLQNQNDRKDELSNSMAMLIVLNTASLQIIPTTVIAIRTSLGSSNPSTIIIPVWIATVSAAIATITATKIFIKFSKVKGYSKK